MLLEFFPAPSATLCCKGGSSSHIRWRQHLGDSWDTPGEPQCLSTGWGVQPKPCQGTFSQVTEDPLSFPKAKGASAVVDLGMNSQDTDEKGKTGKTSQCVELEPEGSTDEEAPREWATSIGHSLAVRPWTSQSFRLSSIK